MGGVSTRIGCGIYGPEGGKKNGREISILIGIGRECQITKSLTVKLPGT